MFTLTVRGNLVEVAEQMNRIRELVKGRKALGWRPFRADEEWLYHSREDNRVCPVCEVFANRRMYNGTNIPTEFPLNKRDIGIKYRKPQVHLHKPWLKGVCRCQIEWVDPIGTLETRLGEEMVSVI